MMTIIHWNRSHATPHPYYRDRVEPRWCFRCRKRLPGTSELMVEPEGSYYDNYWRFRCDGCDEDHRHFPGCDPE